MSVSQSAPASGPTRRAALVAATAGIAGLSACDLPGAAPNNPDASSPTRTGAASPSTTSTPDDLLGDSDRALVDDVLAHTAALLAAAESVATRPGRRHRDGRRSAPALAALHEAHLAVLAPDGHDPAPSSGTIDWTRLRADEEAYADTLRTAALAGDSGPLARVLASMHAAVVVAVTVAERPAGRPGSRA